MADTDSTNNAIDTKLFFINIHFIKFNLEKRLNFAYNYITCSNVLVTKSVSFTESILQNKF